MAKYPILPFTALHVKIILYCKLDYTDYIVDRWHYIANKSHPLKKDKSSTICATFSPLETCTGTAVGAFSLPAPACVHRAKVVVLAWCNLWFYLNSNTSNKERRSWRSMRGFFFLRIHFKNIVLSWHALQWRKPINLALEEHSSLLCLKDETRDSIFSPVLVWGLSKGLQELPPDLWHIVKEERELCY